MDLHKRYTELSIRTEDDLKTVIQSLATVGKLSQLSLLEVDPLLKQVGHLVPAGNVPSLILRGLARLPGRRLPQKIVRRDVDLLFKGIEETLDRAVYTTFFAGPAAVIWGYQNLLKLSGIDLSEAFPEGLWQFYADYALREDTARHTNETHGFDTSLNQRQIRLDKIDRAAAWVMAAIRSLYQYEALLENEWRERVYIRLLIEETGEDPDAAHYLSLHRAWQSQLPYGLDPEALAGESYPAYRRRKFDQFLTKSMANLSPDLRIRWAGRINEAEQRSLPAYLRQMSILAYLAPGPYGETRTPLPLERVHVGLIWRGDYYLIPICQPGMGHPPDIQTVRAWLAAILAERPAQAEGLACLAGIKRAAWPALRRKLSGALIENLDRLRLAPILLNLDPGPRHAPLSELRQAERGIGDHALTLFDTGETFVFDQSHIFFDGGWGAALAEIMTQEALAWADQIHRLKAAAPVRLTPPELLRFKFDSVDLDLIERSAKVMSEVSAETDLVDLEKMLELRRRFKQRNDQIRLTINDLLVLYRAIHAATYEPEPGLAAELRDLAQAGPAQAGALSALEALDKGRQINPTIAIPVDTSSYSPRDRLQPITFEVPLQELNLLALHQNTVAAWQAYQRGKKDRAQLSSEFQRLRQEYLTNLMVLGLTLRELKEAAVSGKTTSASTLKLLAHLPTSLQRLLDKVPGRFDLLNDLIKGREAFSNVGAVAPASSLTRFISAKDDNDKKILVWGVITDAKGVMRISLRDFRPHVGLLTAAGDKALAARITRDYLESYARGLNNFVSELYRIIKTNLN